MRYFQIFLLLTVALSCNSELENYEQSCGNPNVTTDDYFLHVDSIENFKLLLPKSWFMVEPFDYFKLVMYDTTNFNSDSTVQMLSVEHYDLQDGQNFDEFIQDVKDRTEKTIKDSGEQETFLITSTKYILDGRTMVKSTTEDKTREPIIMRTGMFYILDGRRVFVLTLGTNGQDFDELLCSHLNSLTTLKEL